VNEKLEKPIKFYTMIKKPIPKGYKDEHYPPVPTRGRKFMRKFWPFQIIRFFVLNFKIMRIVVGGHS
jgi:hypothetical protein